MIFWTLFGLYWLGWLLTWRVIAYRLAWSLGEPETDDIVFALFFGAFASLAWPIIVPFGVLHQRGLLTGGAHAFMRAPRDVRLRESEEREREAIRHIAELERELGIK